MARYSYSDTGVFDLITSGVSLTGEVENSGLFNSVNKPATLSVQQLREEADNITDETLAQVRPQSPEIDQTVLRKTLQEVENGWLTGPIPRHLVPPGSVVCRRFGLCQGFRLIDDMRPVNRTVSTFESPRPHTVDVLAAMGRELMSACPAQGTGLIQAKGPSFRSLKECLQFLEDFSLLVVVGVQGFVHCVDLVLR